MLRLLFPLLLLVVSFAHAQFVGMPVGANRPDVSWHRLLTEHFEVIYHDGLEEYAREAADVAEAIYPVVTGNLRTPIEGRTPLYLSDLDDIPNAFAFDDDYMYIWMRGILDDLTLGGIRSSGNAKWFRAVITHEFTHVVIAAATRTWIDNLFPAPSVPRWFNEGTARFMEPDGWTSDVDQVLRVAAVNGGLNYNLGGVLDGVLLYETGHSLVRYMTWRFGDTIIAKILHGGRALFGYDFNQAVHEATGMSMGEIQGDWRRTVTVLYGAEYFGREEIIDISEPIVKNFDVIPGIRFSPDGKWIALFGWTPGDGSRLYLVQRHAPDSLGPMRRLTTMSGFDPEFSWSPDGSRLVLSKGRYGRHDALVHDLYIIEREGGEIRRLTTDAALTDPSWSPDGRTIVAVEKRFGRDNLVLVDPVTGVRRWLTSFEDDVQVYTPSWSPDASRIAFSLFDEAGLRSVAVIDSSGEGFRRLTSDTANNRYPVWSPDGNRIAFTSHASGVPNLVVMNADGTNRRTVTDAAGGLYSVQWMPESDSIVAISFNTRDRIVPHLIPASRRVVPTQAPPEIEKYTAWQKVRFSLPVPHPDSIPATTIVDEGSYSSLLNISPLVPVFPTIGSDIDRGGTERDLRAGLFTLWNDPQNIHTIIAYGDYGSASRAFGGEFFYLNNYLPVMLALHGDYSLGFRRMVADSAYFQRDRALSLSAEGRFLHPDRFDITHTASASVGFRELQPWNTLDLPDALRPSRASHGVLTLGYRYQHPKFWINAGAERGLALGDGSTNYTRLTAQTDMLLGSSGFGLIGSLRGAAQWGSTPPQDFLGLDRYDQLQGGFALANFTSLNEITRSYRVRGVRRYQYGDRVAVGSLGLAMRLSFAERLLPILSMFSPQTVLFAEAGSAWNADSTALFDIPITAGYGVELRSELFPHLFLSAGIAFEMIERPRRDLYVRVSAGM